MGKRDNKGFRLDLGDELNAKFAAFAATHIVKTKTDIIRQLVLDHMESVLKDDRERRRRYYEILSGQRPARRAKR